MYCTQQFPIDMTDYATMLLEDTQKTSDWIDFVAEAKKKIHMNMLLYVVHVLENRR